jgi:hypothetical protein
MGNSEAKELIQSGLYGTPTVLNITMGSPVELIIDQPASAPVSAVAPKTNSLGKQRGQETLDHQRAIRKIFAGVRRSKRKADRPYCVHMDETDGIETRKAWQERPGTACPRRYVDAWDYPDPDARRDFQDLIRKEVTRTFQR